MSEVHSGDVHDIRPFAWGTHVLLIVIENDQNGHFGIGPVHSTTRGYHVAFLSTDTEERLRMAAILNALQYRRWLSGRVCSTRKREGCHA